MEQTHLGWERMPLELAAGWLHQRFGERMDGVLIALPGARSGRILSELLALNHRDRSITEGYQKLSLGHLREGIERVTALLLSSG